MQVETPGTPAKSEKRSRNTRRSHIGGYISQLRTDRGLTLSQLSQMSGISQSHLGRIERDQVRPSYSVILSIAESLNEDLGSFASVANRSATVNESLIDVLEALGMGQPDIDRVLQASLDAREILLRELGGQPG